jgi:uncharacterized protein
MERRGIKIGINILIITAMAGFSLIFYNMHTIDQLSENQMKNAILLHGTGDSPNSFWFPYIKKELEKRGYDVWAPQLPEHEMPNLEIQLPYLLQHGTFNSDTIIIAHSAGCPLVLALLEKIQLKIKQVILVAGFVKPIGKLQALKAIVQEEYDWQKIKDNVSDFIAIHSDNDLPRR